MRDWLVAHCHVSRAACPHPGRRGRQGGGVCPALSDALSDGRLTLDVFAPLAAVATPATDADLAQASEHWTPRQARSLAAEVKGATDADAATQFQRRFVRFDDERCLLWAQLTGDAYALVKSPCSGGPAATTTRARSDPDYVRVREPVRGRPARHLHRAGSPSEPGRRNASGSTAAPRPR